MFRKHTVTVAEAQKVVKKLNDDLNSLYAKEDIAYKFNAAVGENIEDCRPDYDFNQMREDINELHIKIRNIKHIINEFNQTHTVFNGIMTIDMALVEIPLMQRELDRLNTLRKMLPKQRAEMYGGNRGNIIDYTYANYDIERAETLYKFEFEALSDYQNEIDKVNSTNTVEIEY